jgi:DNA-binding transcriptional ArsR family regulator
MRPLVHPALEDMTVEGILHALSNPVRVAIFTELAGVDFARTCSNFLTVSDRNIPKSTLSQHFKILRDAGLIRSERSGVEMRNTSRCAEIEGRFPGLIPAVIQAHKIESADLRNRRSRGGKRRAPA